MSSEVETSLALPEILRDSSTSLGMTKLPRSESAATVLQNSFTPLFRFFTCRSYNLFQFGGRIERLRDGAVGLHKTIAHDHVALRI
ncbi:MAG: hypothetical protein QOI22_1283 [Verrucomicrobiota bacterium]